MKRTVLMLVATVCMSLVSSAQERGNGRDYRGESRGGHGGRDHHDSNDRYGRDNHHDSNRWSGRGGVTGYGGGYSSGNSVVYVTQKVWVAGCSEQVWVPARYEYVRQSCGRLVRVCVSQGYYSIVQRPGYYTYQRVPAHPTGGYCGRGSGFSVNWSW